MIAAAKFGKLSGSVNICFPAPILVSDANQCVLELIQWARERPEWAWAQLAEVSAQMGFD